MVFYCAVTIVKRLSIVLLIVAGAILILLLRDRIGPPADETARSGRGRRTVEDRLAQFGESARRRLLPYFENAQISYPPDRLVFVGLKQEKTLEIWASGANGQFKLIRTYPILGASGRLGPKLREGDRQVPEGIYRIESLNPNSKFHLSIRINYANNGDTIEVQPGTYTGPGNHDIDFLGKVITVTGIDPDDPNTVAQTSIDCNSQGRG